MESLDVQGHCYLDLKIWTNRNLFFLCWSD